MLGMPSRSGRALAYGLVVLSVLVTAHLSGVDLGALFDAEGSASGLAILEGFADPESEGDYLWRIFVLSIESLLIGVLATTLAALLGFVLALMAIRVPRLEDAPEESRVVGWALAVLRLIVRTILAIFRSIPDIVWAFLFVRMLGLGPGPAVLAIMISTGGIFGKLFAELADAVEPESIRALRRMGVGHFAILLHGVLPQVWRQWVGYAFYRLECSFRSATILGIVGAGGIGSEIALSIRYYEYDKLATCLLAVLVFVVLVEWLSSFLRRRPFKYTLWLATACSVIALIYLPIPWSELTTDTLVPSWLTHGGPTPSSEFLVNALKLAGETVAMAWCATWVAAAIALPLSPLTSATLNIRGHRVDMVRGRFGIGRIGSWLLFGVSRLIVQSSRAMPELTLALIFVVWVGPGPFAGVLAIGVHTIGVLARLYSDIYEDVEPGSVAALENAGASRFGIWLYGVFPQSAPRMLTFTLYRFEVNVRATAMVGFVGAGGIGDSIDTSISLFQGQDLLLLLAVLFGVVVTLDFFGDRIRQHILTRRFKVGGGSAKALHGVSAAPAAATRRRRARRFARAKGVLFRERGAAAFEHGTIRSLSQVGLFIETVKPYTADTVLEIGFSQNPNDPDTPDLESISLGRVVYLRTNDEVPGMGIELIDPVPEDRDEEG